MHSLPFGSVNEFCASVRINNRLFQIFTERCVDPFNEAKGEKRDPVVE